MLPADLQSAELEALSALQSALSDDPRGRWSLEWRFEGLRLMPVVLRLLERLVAQDVAAALRFPDAGAAALACRDAPALAGSIASFRDPRREGFSDQVLLLVAPSQPDYDAVEAIAGDHRGALVLINPALVDSAVGIGSVARQRRRGLLAQIRTAYALQPLAGAALRRAHPGDWDLFRLDADGYRFAASFPERPDAEAIEQALDPSKGLTLGRGLQRLDDLLEGLQR